MPRALPVSRGVVALAVLAGASELLPIPFLDDALRDRFRRRLARDLARRHHVALSPEAIRLLALGPRADRRPGVVGCLHTLVWRPTRYVAWKLITKLIRKLTVVLAVKEAIDTVTRVLYEGYLLEHAFTSGSLRADGTASRTAQEARHALDDALDGFDTRPMERVARRLLRGGWRSLRRLHRPLLEALQDEREAADRQGATSGEQRLEEPTAASNLAELRSRFERSLASR